jgi:hypothetical protein
MDLKLQVYRDDREVPGTVDWDQRRSEGEFRGAQEGMHVKTLGEIRVDDATAALLTDPDKLADFIQEGDCVMDVITRALAGFKPGDSLPLPTGAALPWNRVGILAYDND